MLKKISLAIMILICLVGCSENKVVNGTEIKISKIKDFNVSVNGSSERGYHITGFSEGFLDVQNNSGIKGFVDKNGNLIGRCIYTYTSDFSEGLASVVSLNYKHGFINEKGKEVIPLIYNAANSFSGGLARVAKDGKWGVIDTEGNTVVDFIYDNVNCIINNNYLIAVKKDEKWSILDRNGEKKTDYIYDDVENIRGFEEYLEVEKNGKKGVLDKTGKEIVQLEYDFISTSEDIITLEKISGDDISIDRAGNKVAEKKEKIRYKRKDSKIGFVDEAGNELTEFVYEYNTMVWTEGMLAVEREDKWGFIDETGKEVIPCVYESVHSFSEGESLTGAKKDGKWGAIDKEGKEIVSFEYDAISSFSDGLASAVKITDEKYAETYIIEQK